jgi:hypothetical protein
MSPEKPSLRTPFNTMTKTYTAKDSMNTTMTKSDTKESLFSIAEHFYALESLIIEKEGEVDETIDQWLTEYQAKESEKIDAYCYVINKYAEIANEAKRLADRAAQYNRTVTNLKERLKFYLETRGQEKVETSRFTIKVTANGGQLPVALVPGTEVEDLPTEFIRVVKEPDMSKLREALVQGDSMAYPFAMFLPRGTHLRIK